MEIIGSHDCGIVEDNLDCLIKIEKGILGVYKHGNTNFDDLNQPKNKKQWNFRKVNWQENKPVKLTNITSNGMEWVWKFSHVIEYMTYKNETQRIFINPNRWQRFVLGWINKKLLVRRITSVEYIIGLVIAFIINIISSYSYDWLTSNNNDKNGVNPNTNQQIKSTINNATINAGSILDTTTNKTINKSNIESSTQDLSLHQKDSLRHDIKH